MLKSDPLKPVLPLRIPAPATRITQAEPQPFAVPAAPIRASAPPVYRPSTFQPRPVFGVRVVQRMEEKTASLGSWANARHRAIATVIRLILARLDHHQRTVASRSYGGSGAVPTLATLASKAVTSTLPGSLDVAKKRGWQFAATGLLDASADHNTQVVYSSNDMKPMATPNPGLEHLFTVPDLRSGTVKPGGRVYHAETRLASEGCRHITVTDGRNCIFCALFFLAKQIPYEYHVGDVKSWHLPEPLSMTTYFGAEIDTYVKSEEFTGAYGAIAGPQALIDLLTSSNSYWWP
jgi:hypothetical protein